MSCEIVLVDDDPEFSASIKDLLELEGYLVHPFATPDGALEWLLADGRGDIVLLDLRTPGISALRFRAVLMSSPALRDLAVVVISGDPQVHKIANAVGANDAFAKPPDVDRLLASVARHCRKRRDS